LIDAARWSTEELQCQGLPAPQQLAATAIFRGIDGFIIPSSKAWTRDRTHHEEKIMLDWLELTNRQRTVCVFLSLLLAAGIAAELDSLHGGLSSVLESVSVVLLLVSILLNPAWVRVRLSSFDDGVKQLLGSPIPRACKIFAAAALGAFFLARLVNLLG